MIWTALWVYVVDGWGRAEALTEIPWESLPSWLIVNHYYWFATIPIQYLMSSKWLFTSGLSVSTGIDIILTTYLTVLLRRSRTGYSTSTDSMIRVIVVYTIQTGAVTCGSSCRTISFSSPSISLLASDTNVHVIPRTEDGLPRPNDDSEEQKVVQAPKKPALEDTDTAVSEES
ncbi:hypothetical protein IEO21_06170 [Rhodonia placenta]|uniref:DUF6534 domain-containing protein n=1 Tax=Rhodonia placenta TaxID=104341 RepID=A0A8H7U0V9_9APHY|nr:hypothetical protein IEO21_06170 [Postia placenta]